MMALACRIFGHRLGPELDGRILCERCGDVFDADLLREFEAILGKPGALLPAAADAGAEDV